MEIVAHLLSATICVAGQCFPALVGHSTPVGTYQLAHLSTLEPGYGGDVLVFHELPDRVLAIHRLYILGKAKRRVNLLNGPTEGRTQVTNGCINVAPDVYGLLVEHADEPLLILKD